MYRYGSLVTCASVFAVGIALIASPLSASAAEPATAISPAQVDANYQVTLNGFDIGSFRYSSNVTRDHYALDTDVELSALLGVFHWKGVTRSSGNIVADKALPAGFRFDFDSTVKSGSVQMAFDGAGVKLVSVQPTTADPADMVPLEPQHLKGVLDPLTAIMALTQTAAATPCGRSVSIFDGKQRFDLILRYARSVRIGNETGVVCRVKYVPIGGYRANDETRAIAANNGIEITFRPVPRAKIMLPQMVAVPTAAGTAQLTLTHVDIRTEDNRKVALVD